MKFENTKHFSEMLKERNLDIKWIKKAIDDPDYVENYDDGTTHFIKQIAESNNRWLRCVINNTTEPPRGVTAFFDRRLRKQYEDQSRQTK